MNDQVTDNEPNLLSAIQVLQKDTSEQVKRLKQMMYEGKLDHETLAGEFAETFLPLLQDTIDKIFEVQYMAQRFGDDVAQKLWPDGEDDPSGLWPEDAQVFKTLLGEYKIVLESSLEHTEGAAQSETEKKITLIDRALARVDELTIVDEAEDAEEEDEEEDDDKPN
jgi:hypothetical protein